ncbi:MAG: hypothetical protein PF503_14745 [Desulfobacula sp.]|jgi:hypothetical protein|nr:hypothetical protein [Desulfobacula sp.]
MKKSGYKNIYLRVVNKANLDKIKHILNESGYYNENTVEEIEYEEKDNLSYFSLTVDSTEHLRWGAYAMLDGIFIEINSIVPQWKGMFYLPILITRKITNEKLKSIINPDMLKEHELHHLQHIIEHIDRCPGYIEDSRKYNTGSCTYADIEKSIAFEVNKLFSIELPAIVADYEKGERNFYLHSDGLASMATSHDKHEFVQYNLAQYIVQLRLAYISRFVEKQTEISNFIVKEVNEQGEKRFGENTMSKIAMVLLKCVLLAQNKGEHFEIEDCCI